MTCWQILNLAPTSDKKAIKKAYAKLLKQNKPDENPKGFAVLHGAYKGALQQAPYIEQEHHVTQEEVAPTYNSPQEDLQTQDGLPSETYHNSSPAVVEENVNVSQYFKEKLTQPVEANPFKATDNDPPSVVPQQPQQEEEPNTALSDHHQAENSDEHQLADYLNQQWNELTERTHDLLSQYPMNVNVEDWVFLRENDALLDFEFKQSFSRFLLEAIMDKQEDIRPPRAFNQHLIHYFDQVFHWHEKRDLLEDEYGVRDMDLVLGRQGVLEERPILWTSPKKHQGPIEFANYHKRMVATIFDNFLVFFLAWFLVKIANYFNWYTESLEYPQLMVFAGVLYLVIAPIMEALPTQGTPGKILFDMKVTSPKGKRLNIFHSFIRQIMFAGCMAGIKVTVWINLIFMDHRLLHDRLSYSIVIKRR